VTGLDPSSSRYAEPPLPPVDPSALTVDVLADTGRRIYGCRFLEMADESRDRLERVLADDRRAPASIDLGALRDLMAEAAPEAGGWRRRLRRTA